MENMVILKIKMIFSNKWREKVNCMVVIKRKLKYNDENKKIIYFVQKLK